MHNNSSTLKYSPYQLTLGNGVGKSLLKSIKQQQYGGYKHTIKRIPRKFHINSTPPTMKTMQLGGSFFGSLSKFLGLAGFFNKRKLLEFKKKHSIALKHIQDKTKAIESLATIYKNYSIKHLKIVEEQIIGIRAESIFPMMETKVLALIEAAKKKHADNAAAGKTTSIKEYTSQLSQAKAKKIDIERKMISLKKEIKTLGKKLLKHKKLYDKEFKSVNTYISEYQNISKYYVEKVQDFIEKLDIIKMEHDSYKGTPEKSLTAAGRKAISRFEKYRAIYVLIQEFNPRNNLDLLEKEKDKLINMRTNMEHYHSEFHRMTTGSLIKWKDNVSTATNKLEKCTKTSGALSNKFSAMLKAAERMYELISTQQMLPFSVKIKSFIEHLKKCNIAMTSIKTQLVDVEQHFYNLVSAAKLDYNLQVMLAGVRTMFVILKDEISRFINTNRTRIHKLPSAHGISQSPNDVLPTPPP